MDLDYKYFLNRFLNNIKAQSSSNIWHNIDKKAILTIDTPIYATLAYSETKSLQAAIRCHNFILKETRYILLLDYYYETSNIDYFKKAKIAHRQLLKKLTKHQAKELLDLEKKVFAFWSLEKALAKKLRQKKHITKGEIEEYTLRKSTDVFLYALILSFVSDVPQEVLQSLYTKQIIRDFEDCYTDLREDLKQSMPNPFLMRLYNKNIKFDDKFSQKRLEKLVKSSKAFSEQKAFIRIYCKSDHHSVKLLDKRAWKASIA